MIARFTLMAVAALMVMGSAILFEASAATASAMNLIENARTNDAPGVRAQLLARAERLITQSWARPALWHAGAAEAHSAAAWLQGADNAQKRAESRDMAVQAVTLSPVLPHAWLRLALLDEMGLTNPLCGAKACLARSWQSAPVLPSEAECVRLGAGYRNGDLDLGDPRLAAYLDRTPRRQAAACLSGFLEPREAFALLLRTG